MPLPSDFPASPRPPRRPPPATEPPGSKAWVDYAIDQYRFASEVAEWLEAMRAHINTL